MRRGLPGVSWATASGRTALGELLTQQRLRNQITTLQLAKAVGFCKTVTSRLLNQECPKLSTALKLGRALGVPDSRVVQAWAEDRIAAEGLNLKVYVAPGRNE